ncbi:transcription initiation factor TFIID subunit 6 [Drosophila innubila]|uniref:transcription initiation factor TFIID subunit 6 n=1 Tax=Drosophila innubila TaxID=198719 RepID=UPI00148CF36A|nr:transcription initiation factor TFIID subunit 6 [Drosophila innubila]
MRNFLHEFQSKVELNLKKNSKDYRKIYTGTLSRTSVRSIGNHCIGETLSDNMIDIVGREVRENINKILEEAVKHARRSRSSTVQLEHLQYAMQEHGVNLDLLHIDYRLPEVEVTVQNAPTRPRKRYQQPKKKWTRIIRAMESLSLANRRKLAPRGVSKPWVKREQVQLMSNRKFPLSKEQQKYYVLITESIMGTSETLRREALRSVNTDSSLQPMLSKLCLFIAEGIKLNVLQHNVSLLFYLLRLVHSLLGNTSLRLNNYLHLLIPSVISCIVARQVCTFPTVQNHWALREYACNIAAEFVKTYNNNENGILTRIINLFKDGLQAPSLTTVYGSIIGLQKMGKFPICEYVIPQIAAIADRIAPYLTESSSDNLLNKQAATFIRYRILKMCAPILKTTQRPPDQLEEYIRRYRFLGDSLCDAVVIERILCDAFKQATEYVNCQCNE